MPTKKENKEETQPKMTQEMAEQIVHNYTGMNGGFELPIELEEAKDFLKPKDQ